MTGAEDSDRLYRKHQRWSWTATTTPEIKEPPPGHSSPTKPRAVPPTASRSFVLGSACGRCILTPPASRRDFAVTKKGPSPPEKVLDRPRSFRDDGIEGRQFVATAPSEISDPNDRESLEPVKEKLRQDLLHQLEETLGYPHESTGIIVAFVE
jgi:hypothetical protein